MELEQVLSSISYVERYTRTIDKLTPVKEAIKEESFCPFCKQENVEIDNEINKLSDAIDWLNTELRKAPQMLESFLPEKRKLEQEIKDINEELKSVSRELRKILEVNEQLDKNKSLEEQALKVVLLIENELEWSLNKKKIFSGVRYQANRRGYSMYKSKVRGKI